MSAGMFFMASGVIAWGFIIWRAVQLMRGVSRRLRWALFGSRPKPVHRYGGHRPDGFGAEVRQR